MIVAIQLLKFINNDMCQNIQCCQTNLNDVACINFAHRVLTSLVQNCTIPIPHYSLRSNIHEYVTLKLSLAIFDETQLILSSDTLFCSFYCVTNVFKCATLCFTHTRAQTYGFHTRVTYNRAGLSS